MSEIKIIPGNSRPTGRCCHDKDFLLVSNDLIMPEQIKALRAEGKIGDGQGYTIGIQYVTTTGSGSLRQEEYCITITDHVDASD